MNAETIKALRCCIVDFNSTQSRRCNECPYRIYADGKKTCENKAKRDAADALEAAEQHIARLVENLKTREAEREVMQDTIKICEEAADRYKAQMPKEGEWIEDDTTYCGADRANYKCSLCGKIGGTWKRGLTQDELPNYCANCGCAMGGEKK